MRRTAHEEVEHGWIGEEIRCWLEYGKEVGGGSVQLVTVDQAETEVEAWHLKDLQRAADEILAGKRREVTLKGPGSGEAVDRGREIDAILWYPVEGGRWWLAPQDQPDRP